MIPRPALYRLNQQPTPLADYYIDLVRPIAKVQVLLTYFPTWAGDSVLRTAVWRGLAKLNGLTPDAVTQVVDEHAFDVHEKHAIDSYGLGDFLYKFNNATLDISRELITPMSIVLPFGLVDQAGRIYADSTINMYGAILHYIGGQHGGTRANLQLTG